MPEDQQAKPSSVDPGVIEFKRLEVSQSRFHEIFSTIRTCCCGLAILDAAVQEGIAGFEGSLAAGERT
jgi:hypothetical protein